MTALQLLYEAVNLLEIWDHEWALDGYMREGVPYEEHEDLTKLKAKCAALEALG